MHDNILNVNLDITKSSKTFKARSLSQWDYGIILKITGVELPSAYTVHFSNEPRYGNAKTSVGDENGVAIPDEYLTTGENVYAWLYLHTGEDDGETVYSITIPVDKRPKPIEDPPTPQQQGLIDQAIAALNAGVEAAENAQTAAETAQEKSETAQGKAEDAQGYAETAQGLAEDARDAAQRHAGEAYTSAQTAIGRARDAVQASNDAGSYKDAAGRFELMSEGYALGTQNGTPVSSGVFYHNNSKYFSDVSENYATNASNSATSANAAKQAIMDMTVEAFTLPPQSSASVEKIVDPLTGVVTLRFGSVKGDKGEPGTSWDIHICISGEYDETTRIPTISNPNERTIYLVPSAESTTNDLFVEWIYANNAWEMFGSASIDLSDYITKVSGAVEGNFAALDSNGGLIDSGHKHGDYASKSDTVLDTTLSHGRVANTTVGDNSIAYGSSVTASGANSQAVGVGVTASAVNAHAEGSGTTASGVNAHAEGAGTTASGAISHAEGAGSQATGNQSHAEGAGTVSSGDYSHAEGGSTTASGNYSHAEGAGTTASGMYAHAEGINTIAAANSQHVVGMYNVEDTYDNWPEWSANTHYYPGDRVKRTTSDTVYGYTCNTENTDSTFTLSNWNPDNTNKRNYVEIVGIGDSDSNRANGRTLDWQGNEYLAGDVYVGCNDNSTGGTKLAKVTDIPTVPVQDVQVNGTSILNQGVANVPLAALNVIGAVSTNADYGVVANANGRIQTTQPSDTQIKEGTNTYRVISPRNQHTSAFYGLAKAAGDTTQSQSSNAVGTYTDAAKSAIRSMIGATSGDVIAVSDTQPTDPENVIWLPETAPTSVAVPTVSDVDNMLAQEEEDLTSSAHAYVIGDLFTSNAKMYCATAAIAVNDAIVVGTNCVVVNAASVFPHDVQVNGTSILNNGVANVPVATSSTVGVVRADNYYGVDVVPSGSDVNMLRIRRAESSHIKAGTNAYKPIAPVSQHESAFYGLAKAAGDSTQSASSNAVGTYTESAKSSIASMLNAPESVSGSTPSITAKAGIRYVCGEVATLDITLPASGIVDVVFESGSTPTVLTVTPPTGVTVKWANGFDPTSLEANTTYEINIADGLGVAASWT